MSYAPYPDNSYAYNFPVRANNAFNPAVVTYGPAVLADGVTPATLEKGFPAPSLPPVPSNGIITSASSAAAANVLKTSNLFVVNPNFKNPYVESWNAAIQKSLPGRLVLEVAYVGNRGVDNVVNYNLNAATVIGTNSKTANNGRPEFLPFGRTAATNLLFSLDTRPATTRCRLSLTSGSRMVSQARPRTRSARAWAFRPATMAASRSTSINAAITPATTSIAHKPSSRVSFTTSPSARASNYSLPEWAPQSWVDGAFPPFLTIMSGLPMYFTAPSGSLLAPDNTQTPQLVAPVKILHGIGPGNPWFSTSSFASAASGTFGNVGRNYLSGPNFFDLDASVAKSIRMTERFGLELRMEAFGATNTPQFFFNNTNGTPSGGTAAGSTLGSTSFGQITSASTEAAYSQPRRQTDVLVPAQFGPKLTL